jgi:nitrogen regulatory protein PII
MKLIMAIIQPYKLEVVKEALEKIGQIGMTTTEVSGFGRQKGHFELYRGTEYMVDFVHKIKIEIIAPDDQVDRITDLVVNAARSGKIGDGKIFILNLIESVRIKNGEFGEKTL